MVSGQKKMNRKQKPFIVAYSQKLFSGVNINDIHAALDLWIQELQKTLNNKLQRKLQVRSLFIDDAQHFLSSPQSAKVDVINLTALDYVLSNPKNSWTVRIFNSSEGIYPVPLLLLVNAQAGIGTISGLRNKSITIPAGQQKAITKIWLDKLIMENESCPAGRFFKEIIPSIKPTKAVLDLFFGEIDVCIIGLNTFNTMAELNPQIKKKLKIIQQSPPFLKTVTCFNKKYDAHFIQAFIDMTLHLRESPKGQQILALFGGQRVRIYNQTDLFRNENALLAAYKKLIAKIRK